MAIDIFLAFCHTAIQTLLYARWACYRMLLIEFIVVVYAVGYESSNAVGVMQRN
jgi:hypothetical protein